MSMRLGQTVAVDSIGTGWIAMLGDERVHIEFDDASTPSIIVPRSHVEASSRYDLHDHDLTIRL